MNLIISILLAFVPLIALEQPKAENTKFSIVGVWMMEKETAPDGKEVPQIYTQYTRCKIYDADSTYYTVQLHAVGEDMMIIAHEMGRYRLNDSVYMERDRVMPFEWVNDSTFVTVFNGYKETMVRSRTMTEERMQEIRDLVRTFPDEAEAPVKHFVLSTTERKLKAENKVFLVVIIGMVLVAFGVAVYVIRLRKRKREIEKKLSEIEEEHGLRPVVVADAMKQVEKEFFLSDYYLDLHRRIEAGDNLKPDEWKEVEQRLKVVYPRFSNSLRSLYHFSDTELQVCLLLKLRASNKEIAGVIKRAPDSVSSIRNRLYKKVFGTDGGAKEWDEFIQKL